MLKEKVSPASPDQNKGGGTATEMIVTGWVGSCKRYLFWPKFLRKAGLKPNDIPGTKFDFVFVSRGLAFEASGKIVKGQADGQGKLEMEGLPPVKMQTIRIQED